ncbi:uncharacterized protein STEHIDRAFT_96635 [Stereum hirsutum FP-91666 SS1]|uniref:uncharacterized protein n=1 Tax=Stereum hirsutum (strain FP-91666) TaxID=721885 RepID=UPI000440EEFE|nr:uncharacterized protein STEHIDRAFT_96635 [Stereum hirsutum FP-91666 SS1]EIM87498.1 hypothetical protein STEHIDRAFT_96635 [Stereum hirsutum FP-91666 SS1]
MSPSRSVLALFALNIYIPLCFAALYVTSPNVGTTCHAGQSCTIEWLDDGTQPLLSTVGICTVGLYYGELQLVQSIEAVDVSSVHSLTFTPNAEAGPDSSSYYVAFTSTSFTNNSGAYQSFTPAFALDGMSGSFSSPVASLTSTLPIPTTLSSATSPAEISTITLSNTASLSVSTNPASSFTPSTSSAKSTGTGASSSSSSHTTSSSGGSKTSSSSAASSTTAASSDGVVAVVGGGSRWSWAWAGVVAILPVLFS